MKKVEVDGKPHLVLYALKTINAGEELRYSYGARVDAPWRKTKGGKTDILITVNNMKHQHFPVVKKTEY